MHEQREKFVLQTRLGEDTLDLINIDDPSLDNFDTEQLFSDRSESVVTLRPLNDLNDHDSFRNTRRSE